MSSEQSPIDSQVIEQTRQRIRSLVGEIAQLAKSGVAVEEFYNQFLTRVVSALAAVGGAVWTTNEEGRLGLQYQINLQESKLREMREEDQAKHGRLLYKVLASGEAVLVPPQSGAGEAAEDAESAANPTDFLLVLGLLKTELEPLGVVEIFQRSDAGPASQQGYLRFLADMCELAGDFLKNHQLKHFSNRQVLWTQLEDFTRVVHASLNPRETAYTIANEGRRLIECDRLSVAIRRGNKFVVEAISGQDVFNSRSNTVRLLGRLATAVVVTGEPIWYTGDTRDMAPQVEDAVQAYVDEAHSKTVAVLPLQRPMPAEEEEKQDRTEPEAPVGALIVEQIEDNRLLPSMAQRVEVVCRHSSAALANSMQHQNLFLMPVWRALGKSRVVVKARTLPKTLSIGGAILAVLIALFIWPADFRLESKGTLEPAEHRDVFAGTKGVVTKLLVKHGDMVNEGDLLAVLRDVDLDVDLTKVEGQLLTNQERITTIVRQLLESRTLRDDEKAKLIGERQEAEAQQKSLQKQLELLKEKSQVLEVRSPIPGQIVTWDLENKLINRPVQRGQTLMRVADLSKDWQLELHMPENRMGHIALAQQDPELGFELNVKYQLATESGQDFYGHIKEVERSAEVRGEEGNTVLIKVAIDKQELPHLRPGATVTGKVYCGRRSIGYVWFHDVFEFIQSRILFRYF
jgi:multidrug efflux pump subunit AcrA (membrane-fusion protein)